MSGIFTLLLAAPAAGGGVAVVGDGSFSGAPLAAVPFAG